MNEAFPRILTLLRKEKGISQKKAAEDLGISQALLSHYEKGIRECGLDFLVRSADYYQVSCDYLLGRTPDRTGAVLTVDDLPDADFQNTDKVFKGSVLAVLNKKLVTNSLTIVFDLLQKCGNKALTTELSSFLMLAVYLAFRTIYNTEPKNPQSAFSVPRGLATGWTEGEMLRTLACAEGIISGENGGRTPRMEPGERLSITPEALKEQYPYFYQSLSNLVQRAEALLAEKTQSSAK
ncbi:MAG: helix-turn-helix transcriptional regulator [Firmicutes bacterium]|nr:helix-turn-helix transcriptional regulator [Bacillota bacterium]